MRSPGWMDSSESLSASKAWSARMSFFLCVPFVCGRGGRTAAESVCERRRCAGVTRVAEEEAEEDLYFVEIWGRGRSCGRGGGGDSSSAM